MTFEVDGYELKSIDYEGKPYFRYKDIDRFLDRGKHNDPAPYVCKKQELIERKYVIKNGIVESFDGNDHGNANYALGYSGLIFFMNGVYESLGKETSRKKMIRNLLKQINIEPVDVMPVQTSLDLDHEELPSIKESKFEPREKEFEMIPIDTNITPPADVQKWINSICAAYNELNRKYAELAIENTHITAELQECKNEYSDNSFLRFLESTNMYIKPDKLVRIINNNPDSKKCYEILAQNDIGRWVDNILLPSYADKGKGIAELSGSISDNGAYLNYGWSYKGLVTINKILKRNGINLVWEK